MMFNALSKVTLLDHSARDLQIGVRFRHFRGGPEAELVNQFLASAPFRPPSGFRMTLFREPKIDSGFPDLVAVIWSERVAQSWLPERHHLQNSDLRLLHYLALNGATPEALLRRTVPRSLTAALDRLQAAQMVSFVKGHWKPRPVSQLFAARSIIAIEAKLTHTTAAIGQAVLNTWFASESYVLLPKLPRSSRPHTTAQRHGISFCVTGSRLRLGTSLVAPRSYASWLFNEWALRAACPAGPN